MENREVVKMNLYSQFQLQRAGMHPWEDFLCSLHGQLSLLLVVYDFLKCLLYKSILNNFVMEARYNLFLLGPVDLVSCQWKPIYVLEQSGRLWEVRFYIFTPTIASYDVESTATYIHHMTIHLVLFVSGKSHRSGSIFKS